MSRPDAKTDIVQITVWTKDRRPWLANQTVHMHLKRAWLQATAWTAGHYMILPDRIIIFAVNNASSLTAVEWIRFWQSRFNRLHSKPDLRWAPECDTQPVKRASYKHIWGKVRQQPVRDGLVAKAWEWPFQGEMAPFSI